MEVKDGSLLLSSDQKLVNPLGGAMQGFAIAGEAREFHPATVTYVVTGKDSRGREQYDQTKLILTSPMVSKPIHYRYAWSRNPLANVQIIKFKDVPLATQRSDDWTMGFVPLSVAQKDTPRDVAPHKGDVLKALRELDRQRKIAEAKQTLETYADPKK
jgi:sialate O-acetylesterase